MAAATNKDIVLVFSLVLSLASLVLLFCVTWYFQSSLDLLQQQVEHDREVLLKLQEQVIAKSMTFDNAAITKRQLQNGCGCKNGVPGPRGPPGLKGGIGKEGRKGDVGHPGPRGDFGDRGPRGLIGDPGTRGERGQKGTQGDTGDKGSKGAGGMDGEKGTKGENGNAGPKGEKGATGQTGDTGDRGPRGLIGDTGLRGPVGETGRNGVKGDKGPTGEKGEPGLRGAQGNVGTTGLTGPKGQKGMKGTNEKVNGGSVYVRWGHDKCPSTAELVYIGTAGGSQYTQSGGGSNPQCLPLDPNFLTPISGSQGYRALMYGAEYETLTDSSSHVHGVHSLDVPCAVCFTAQRSAVYMIPTKYTCPDQRILRIFDGRTSQPSLYSVYLCGYSI